MRLPWHGSENLRSSEGGFEEKISFAECAEQGKRFFLRPEDCEEPKKFWDALLEDIEKPKPVADWGKPIEPLVDYLAGESPSDNDEDVAGDQRPSDNDVAFLYDGNDDD